MNYWERMNRLYALKIYHWAFLAQPYPLPETLIGGHPDFFLKQKMASQTKSKNLDAIDPRALEHYLAPFRDPSRVHAMCEDYRAGAYADYEIDKSRSRRRQQDHDSDAGFVGRCGHRQRRRDAARQLAELGDQRDGVAGGQRAFSDGGESGGDGEDVAGVFSGWLVITVIARSVATKQSIDPFCRGMDASLRSQ